MVFLLIMSKPQKVKKRWVSIPSPSAEFAMIRPGRAMSRLPFEQMITSLRPAEASSSKEGTKGWSVMWFPIRVLMGGSDAALGLGQPGDVGHLLGGLAREQGEEPLHREAHLGGDAAQGGGLAHGVVVRAEELDDLPVVVGQLDADEAGEGGAEVLGPLRGLREEALLVDLDLVAGNGGGGHGGPFRM